jgi:hypothetical protein
MAHAKKKDDPFRANSSSQKGKMNIIINNWWMVLFVGVCAIAYAHASQKKDQVIASLDKHLTGLKNEKEALLQENEDLNLQVNSQSDPAWIQLTLMKGLGLVPEGQKKVYFCNHDD